MCAGECLFERSSDFCACVHYLDYLVDSLKCCLEMPLELHSSLCAWLVFGIMGFIIDISVQFWHLLNSLFPISPIFTV